MAIQTETCNLMCIGMISTQINTDLKLENCWDSEFFFFNETTTVLNQNVKQNGYFDSLTELIMAIIRIRNAFGNN